MKLILKNVAVYEMWSVIAAKRNVQRQISKAMCTFQPPSAKRKSLGIGLGQKPHFLMLIGIVEDTAQSGLCAKDPEIKIAMETATFNATSDASLIFTSGQTQMQIPWNAAQQLCDLFGSCYSTGATWAGEGCSSAWQEQGHRANQGAPRLRMWLRWIPVGHQEAVSLPPCMAHGQAGHSGLS